MVDSDFSIDENDEPVSDPDDEEGKKRKRKPLSTKAYREPITKKAKASASSKATPQQKTSTSKTPIAVRAVKKTPAEERTPSYTVMDSGKQQTGQ